MVNVVDIAFVTRSAICDLKGVIADLDVFEMTARLQRLFVHIPVEPANHVCDQS
jgi:hypothetical protein